MKTYHTAVNMIHADTTSQLTDDKWHAQFPARRLRLRRGAPGEFKQRLPGDLQLFALVDFTTGQKTPLTGPPSALVAAERPDRMGDEAIAGAIGPGKLEPADRWVTP